MQQHFDWRKLVLTLVIHGVLAGAAMASEFRAFRPILTPAAAGTGSGAQQIIQPVSRTVAKKIADKIVAAWNGNQINSVLAENFYDRSRLNDAMNVKVPRDARLSVLGIQDVQTLGQQVEDAQGDRQLVSTVSITLKTQITFNDPVNGYQRRVGTNEYIVRVRQRLQSAQPQ